MLGAVAGCTQERDLPDINRMAVVLLPVRVFDGRIVRPEAYLVDKCEVTNGQYVRFIEESGYRPANDVNFLSHLERSADGVYDIDRRTADLPVVFVNFADALAYASYHGGEIPTRAEWLAAAGVNPERPYPWGDRFLRFFCNSLRSGIGGPARVGTFESGRSPSGCYDMAGNVAEWTRDVTPESLQTGPVRVHYVMGGSFNDWGHPRNEFSKRVFDLQGAPAEEESGNRIFSLGFRCMWRSAFELVSQYVDRLDLLRPDERREAVLELAGAGGNMQSLLHLLDFRRRADLMARATGLFTLENLRDVTGDGGDEFLIKHVDGKVAAMSRGDETLWSATLDISDRIVPIRGTGGRSRKIAVLESVARRISMLDSRSGEVLWTAQADGEPRRALCMRSPEGMRLLTVWQQAVEEDEPGSTSLLTCHGLGAGRLLWEKHFEGELTDLDAVPAAMLEAANDAAQEAAHETGQGDRPVAELILTATSLAGQRRTEFGLIDLGTGETLAAALLDGEQRIRLFTGAHGGAAYLGIDAPDAFAGGTSLFEIIELDGGPEEETGAGTEDEGEAAPVAVNRADRDETGKVLIEIRIAGENGLERRTVSLDTVMEDSGRAIVASVAAVEATAATEATEGAGGFVIIEDETARALCRDFLGGSFRIKTVLEGTGGSATATGSATAAGSESGSDSGTGGEPTQWIMTEIDRQNRMALISVPGGTRAGTVILLTGVRGSDYRILSGGRFAGDETVLILSSGGTMIRLDRSGGIVWWRDMTGLSGYEPLLAELDGDGSPEVIVFSLYGEISVIDLESGAQETLIRKVGSEITDLEVVDMDGDGAGEILAGFKDEGIYLVDPTPPEQENALDLVLAAMNGEETLH